MKMTVSIICLMFAFVAQAQEAQHPIVPNFGGIYHIAGGKEYTDPNKEYKIVIDLKSGAADWKEASFWVNNVARLMNLHGLSGLPKDQLKVTVVVHGPALFTMLNDETYQERYEVANPNIAIYQALADAGAEILVCGQSLIARELTKNDFWEGTDIALSALTSLSNRQQEGYILFTF